MIIPSEMFLKRRFCSTSLVKFVKVKFQFEQHAMLCNSSGRDCFPRFCPFSYIAVKSLGYLDRTVLTTRTCVHTHNFVCTSCSYRSSAVARRATHQTLQPVAHIQSIVDQCHCGCAGYNTLSRLLPPHVFAFHTDPAWEDSNAICHHHRSVHDIRENYSPASCVAGPENRHRAARRVRADVTTFTLAFTLQETLLRLCHASSSHVLLNPQEPKQIDVFFATYRGSSLCKNYLDTFYRPNPCKRPGDF